MNEEIINRVSGKQTRASAITCKRTFTCAEGNGDPVPTARLTIAGNCGMLRKFSGINKTPTNLTHVEMGLYNGNNNNRLKQLKLLQNTNVHQQLLPCFMKYVSYFRSICEYRLCMCSVKYFNSYCRPI